MRSVFALAAGLLMGMAGACLWDHDTLAAELKGLPELQDVIAGRFDVNPSEYYERRIELMQAKQASGTLVLDDFDNAAMAHDRLGHSKEAHRWLDAKQIRLKKEQAVEKGDDWYRFYANRGTLFAHDWTRAGMTKDTALLDKALADLEKAVAINPEAHFGRETVQIEIIKLMRQTAKQGYPDADRWRTYVQSDRKGVQKGLIGIMSLGVGWNSPDLHVLLASTVHKDDAVLKDALLMRADQHASSGQKHLIKKGNWTDLLTARSEAENLAKMEKQVALLTANGADYRRARAEYVTAALKVGRHPDKDKDFWDAFVPVASVTLPDQPEKSGKPIDKTKVVQNLVTTFVGGMVFLVIMVGALVMFRRR